MSKLTKALGGLRGCGPADAQLLQCSHGTRQLRPRESYSMFRVLFLAATAAALAGCAGSESPTQAAFRADDAKCKSDGANPGTDAYVQCRLAIDLQKANAERAAEAAQRSRPRP